MPDTAVVTSTIGPGLAITAVTFNNVTSLLFETVRKVLTISHEGPNGPKVTPVSLSTPTTITYVITAGNAVVTVS